MMEILVYLFFSLAFGAVACFWGKKLYFPIVMLGAFSGTIVFFLERFGLDWKVALWGAICGVILALFVRFVYKAGLFFLGAFAGIILGMFLMSFIPESIGTIKWLAPPLLALVLGICAVNWCDVFIMLGTSLQGASIIARILCFLLLNYTQIRQYVYADGMFSSIAHLQSYLNHELISQNPTLLSTTLLIMTGLGFLFQLSQARKEG